MDDEVLGALFQDPRPEDQARLQTLTSLFPYFDEELARTGVTRWVLCGEYKQQHPDGYNYSRFCDYYQQWRKSQSATMHLEHEPADKLFIDFTGKKLSIVNRDTGELKPVETYVATRGYNQLTYVQAVASQRNEDLIGATENAFYFFGGVPVLLVPDNMESAVTKADKYESELNRHFLDFANHYGTRG